MLSAENYERIMLYVKRMRSRSCNIFDLERYLAQLEGYLSCLEDNNLISEIDSDKILYDIASEEYKEAIKRIYNIK